MKKRLLPLIAFSGILLLTLSCGKDEVPELTDYTVPKAVIKGKAYADLDLSQGNEGYETAIGNLKIIAQIWTGDLVSELDPNYSYSYKTFTGTTDGSGNYRIEVDATYAGLNVTLYCDDFAFDQKQAKIGDIQPSPVRRVYSAGPYSVFVLANKETMRDIYYSSK